MRTLNGQTLKQLLISGSNNLYNHYPEVDALNVFPVPDGDTGMNMNLTLTSGSKEIQNRSDENAYEIVKEAEEKLNVDNHPTGLLNATIIVILGSLLSLAIYLLTKKKSKFIRL